LPAERLPKRVDLRDRCPPIYDQGGLQSCSANAVAATVEFDLIKQKRQRVIFPSRLFLYYNTRALEHNIRSNVGTSIRDAIKAVSQKGDCPESLWPYIEKKVATRPSEKCFKSALKYKAVKYWRIHRSLDDMKSCLASGYPFVFGFSAHRRFHDEVRVTGILEMPAKGERRLGSHAVVAVGYDEASRRLIVRNSWGRKFGLKGYFTMPYEYLLKNHLSADFWTVNVVS
jgi:C1A family cysteine protease